MNNVAPDNNRRLPLFQRGATGFGRKTAERGNMKHDVWHTRVNDRSRTDAARSLKRSCNGFREIEPASGVMMAIGISMDIVYTRQPVSISGIIMRKAVRRRKKDREDLIIDLGTTTPGYPSPCRMTLCTQQSHLFTEQCSNAELSPINRRKWSPRAVDSIVRVV